MSVKIGAFWKPVQCFITRMSLVTHNQETERGLQQKGVFMRKVTTMQPAIQRCLWTRLARRAASDE